MVIKEFLKAAIYPLYEELAKIDQDQSYTTFCVQWGEKSNPEACCSSDVRLTDGP